MARKKKSEIQEQEIRSEETVDSVSSSTNIAYSGYVTIKLMKNNKPLRTFRKHNTGYTPLFNFLLNCLSNAYNGNDCPKFLRMFADGDGSSPANLGTNAFVSDGYVACSSCDVEASSNKVTYKFIIPTSYIDTSVVTSTNKINCIAIYSTTNIGNQTLPSAYIAIPEDQQISSDDFSSGVSIILLWEMTLDNKSLTTGE